MLTVENPRYEAFAQARAKGALLIDAHRPQVELASHHAPEQGHLDKIFNNLEAEQGKRGKFPGAGDQTQTNANLRLS